MISPDFFSNQMQVLARNFSERWVTEERQKALWEFCKKSGIGPSALERGIMWFVENEMKPSLPKIKERIIKFDRDSESNFSTIIEPCSVCDDSGQVYVNHPEDSGFLIMGCYNCDSECHWDVPKYSADYVIVDNPTVKKVQQLRGKIRIGSSYFFDLVEKNKIIARESEKYFQKILDSRQA